MLSFVCAQWAAVTMYTPPPLPTAGTPLVQSQPPDEMRSPADMRSGHETAWPQTWKPIRMGSSAPARADAAVTPPPA